MAILIRNKSDGPFTLPPSYGGKVLGRGKSAIIADTKANVIAVLGGDTGPQLELLIVKDGLSEAITPVTLGIAAGAITAAKIADGAVTAVKIASGAAASNVGALSGALGGTLPAPTAMATQVVEAAATTVAPRQLLASESGKTFNNFGATAKVGFKLPVWAVNLIFYFAVADTDGIQLQPGNATDVIQLGIVGPTTANTGHADSTVIGSWAKVEAQSSGVWAAAVTGTWTAT